jgi:hypothetical protein
MWVFQVYRFIECGKRETENNYCDLGVQRERRVKQQRFTNIWLVPSSNLGHDDNYSEVVVVIISPSRKKKNGCYLKSGHDHFHPHPYSSVMNRECWVTHF